MNLDTTKLRFGDLIAAGAGLLLIISLFLNWYKVSAEAAFVDASASVSAWDALSFIDILLFLIGVAAIVVAGLRAANVLPARPPVSPGLLVLVLGALAVLLVLFRILSIPDEGAGDIAGIDVGRSFGIFIALIAAAGVTVGGWLGWNEEGRPTPGTAGLGSAPGQQPGGFAAPPPAGPAQQPAPAAPAAPPPAAAQQAQPPPPAGGAADWYPDPRGQKRLRYWDGSQWTDHVAD
jgi:hypothetical protein